MANDEAEGHMFAWTQLIPGKAAAIVGQIPPEPNANETAGGGSSATAAAREENPPPAPLQVSDNRNQPKQLKTVAELAEMIELDLARHPDCPKAGFRVTVYGWPRWRAMLQLNPPQEVSEILRTGVSLPRSSLSGSASGTTWPGKNEILAQAARVTLPIGDI
jgi:hypothetical protein